MISTKRHLLFVYGTLRFRHFRKECFGMVPKARRAMLNGYERGIVVRGGERYFVIRKRRNATTRGALLSLTVTQIRRSDVYERHYSRRLVELASGTKAWAYIPKAYL
ncbi:gamma-glutamylcyclotransferase [Candidatus Kaiserbacteria bacterium]|nr:gamma-glutamylcyclotransferase [Candidatus Kaiserbacteria bacterium]